MSARIPTVVLGGTGYVAGELLRLIAAHPQFELAGILSDSQPGEPVGKAFPHLAAVYPEERFQSQTEVGALISAAHADKVMDYIASGVREGATLVAGGQRVAVPGLAGCFVAPTIFADCRDEMRIVREEIFGPVLALLVFDDEAEAVRRANDTRFGLSAGVFTRDLARAHRVAAQLHAGLCWINNYNVTPIEMPFGGIRESGIGHENSMAALDHYTQLKTVYVELGEVACGYR